MTRNIEKISVLAGGSEYTEWESCEIGYAINQATREFTIDGTEHPGQFRFPPGTPVAILANGTLVLNGYVNKYCPRGDAGTHSVTISGRSKSQDFIDNSANHKTGYFENKNPQQIGAELDEYGVGISAVNAMDRLWSFRWPRRPDHAMPIRGAFPGGRMSCHFLAAAAGLRR